MRSEESLLRLRLLTQQARLFFFSFLTNPIFHSSSASSVSLYTLFVSISHQLRPTLSVRKSRSHFSVRQRTDTDRKGCRPLPETHHGCKSIQPGSESSSSALQKFVVVEAHWTLNNPVCSEDVLSLGADTNFCEQQYGSGGYGNSGGYGANPYEQQGGRYDQSAGNPYAQQGANPYTQQPAAPHAGRQTQTSSTNRYDDRQQGYGRTQGAGAAAYGMERLYGTNDSVKMRLMFSRKWQ